MQIIDTWVYINALVFWILSSMITPSSICVGKRFKKNFSYSWKFLFAEIYYYVFYISVRKCVTEESYARNLLFKTGRLYFPNFIRDYSIGFTLIDATIVMITNYYGSPYLHKWYGLGGMCRSVAKLFCPLVRNLFSTMNRP